VDHRDWKVLAAGVGVAALALAVGRDFMTELALVWGLVPIPIGALTVGFIASLGFCAASYLTGRAPSVRLLAPMALVLVAGCLWVLRENGSLLWQEKIFGENVGAPHPLAFPVRALQLAGFLGGVLLLPAALVSKPHCGRCRRFRRSKLVAIVPGDDHKRLEIILGAARTGSFDEIARAIGAHGPIANRQAIEELPSWLSANLEYCPGCADGALVAKSHRRNAKAQVTATVPLEEKLVREFFA
jgi:hypothetical protein